MESYSKISRKDLLKVIDEINLILNSSTEKIFELSIDAVHPTEGYVFINNKKVIET